MLIGNFFFFFFMVLAGKEQFWGEMVVHMDSSLYPFLCFFVLVMDTPIYFFSSSHGLR